MAVAAQEPVEQGAAKETAGTQEMVVRPLTGNEAIARGVWQAGARVAAAYPGTPSTEILESLARYPVEDLVAQWATNEKVAADVAIGASLAGVRAFAAMKHVGLNVASDALMSASYIGVNGGLVVAVCDDPGIHSSQNEQDTRLFCRLANLPVLEPADAQEALDFTRLAFSLSERFDTPVILRGTTRLSHTRSLVRLGQREQPQPGTFNSDPGKNVMIPGHARLRHPLVVQRESRLGEYFESSPATRWERGSSELGVVTVGVAYTYVREMLPGASILKLASSYPLAEKTVRAFAASVDRVLVVEELEPVIEQAMGALGLAVEGHIYFPRVGELSCETVRQGLEKAAVLAPRTRPQALPTAEPVLRPPVLCAGCPHTGPFLALRAVDARVMGDIGCYTLATSEPLAAIDTCVAMGSSIGNAVGVAFAGTETRPIVAVIGDSTFLHSGIPPLIDAVYNSADITVLILDNHIVAMTGGQDHPGTGRTLRGETTSRVDYQELVRAAGVRWVRTVDSYNLAGLCQTMREAIRQPGVAVVIADRPCVLDPVRVRGTALVVAASACTGCQWCMNLGCPALLWSDELYQGHHQVRIDPELCIGCSLCAQVCSCAAIRPRDDRQEPEP